jgi:hypothetical protein
VKLVHSDGRVLTVRDVGSVIYLVSAIDVPIKYNRYAILHDDDARDLIRELRMCGLYECGATDGEG